MEAAKVIAKVSAKCQSTRTVLAMFEASNMLQTVLRHEEFNAQLGKNIK